MIKHSNKRKKRAENIVVPNHLPNMTKSLGPQHAEKNKGETLWFLEENFPPKEKHIRIKLGWRWQGLSSCFWDSTRDLRKIQAHRSLLDRCVTPTPNIPPTLPPSKTGSVRFNEHNVSPKKQTPKYWAKANQYKVVPKINEQFLPEELSHKHLGGSLVSNMADWVDSTQHSPEWRLWVSPWHGPW